VRFVEMIEAMYAAGARVFVEARPGGVLMALHLPAKAERPHVRPDLTDVLEAFRFRSHSSRIPPTSRVVAVRKPYRVLLFVVHDNLVGHFISAIVFRH
jgi:hypothetical protein